MFSSVVRDSDLERFALQTDSKLPRFSYVGPILHRGRTTCLLGMCICMCVLKCVAVGSCTVTVFICVCVSVCV
jgi:hypothetical protein